MRTWGPAVVVLALLPIGFVALRACLPPIGGAEEAPDIRSAACSSCHTDAATAWAQSTHARAEWGFDAPGAFPHGWREAVAPHGAPVGAIGIDPLFQLLVPMERGRIQVTQLAWDPAEQEWFDVFDDVREPGDWGHWTGGAMTWNSQCASCHATEVHKNYDAATDTYDTEVSEHGVGCVACHGTDHAASLTDTQMEDVCLSCHSLRAELTGTFRPGDAYLDHFSPTWVDRTDGFTPDGQIRTESFEATAFLGSKMHGAGVTCTSCHDAHTGTLVRPEGELCEGCHTPMPTFEPHDPHPNGTVGCVGCHMPVTTYMQRDPRHDHGFPILDPRSAPELGPDGCTRCHTDQDRAWAATTAAEWWPAAEDRTEFSRAVAAARAGDAAAVPVLLRATRSARPVGQRATALLLLGAWSEDPMVLAALTEALRSDDPRIRLAAATGAGRLASAPAPALTDALADPVRAIRVEAASTLRADLSPSDPRLGDYLRYLRHNADQPTTLHEWGTWHFDAGNPAGAVALLERAVALDHRSPLLRDSLAVALAAAGHPARAAAELRAAVELSPLDPVLWMRLGLAEAGNGDSGAAVAALRRAVELDPDDARTWYNLGLAEVGAGDRPVGIESLTRAAALAPDDVALRFGLAATLRDGGDMVRARSEAERILALDPTHPGARALLSAGPSNR